MYLADKFGGKGKKNGCARIGELFRERKKKVSQNMRDIFHNPEEETAECQERKTAAVNK